MDIRSILDKLHIEWKDHGHNCSYGHVNIRCVFCKSDPSEHLAINESTGAYYCYRGGKEHSGYDLVKLLIRASKKSRADVLALVAKHNTKSTRLIIKPDRIDQVSREITIALKDGPELTYLSQRLELSLDEARVIATELNLRRALAGRLAYRVIFPITDFSGNIIAYTGRAILDRMSERYYTVGDIRDVLYLPDLSRLDSALTLVLCEGPFDALQVYRAMRDGGYRVSAAAVLGSELTQGKIALLKSLMLERLFYCPDRDVEPTKVARTWLSISQMFSCEVRRLDLTHEKDLGATPPIEIERMLLSA